MILKNRTDTKRFPSPHLLNDPVLARIYSRLHHNDQNWLSVMIGDTGSGKSGCAISMAIMLDVNKQGKCTWYYKDKSGEVILPKICFSAKEFISLIERDDLPKGSIIIWDEAGVENDNTEWNSAKSRLIKHVMQTFRYKNLGLILTVPDIESIAIGTRRLLHTKIIVEDKGGAGIPRHLVRRSKVYWLRKNRITGEIRWLKDLYLDSGDENRYKRVDSYLIPKPPQEVYDAYNKKKQEQLDKWYNGMSDEIDFIYDKLGVSKDVDTDKYNFEDGLKHIIKHPKEFFDPKTNSFNKDLIAYDLNWNDKMAEKARSILNIKFRQGKLDIHNGKLLNKPVNDDYDLESPLEELSNSDTALYTD